MSSERARTAAGLHDVRVHDLRHAFAVHGIQAGLPLPRLQKLLGHATPAMTMRYTRHTPEAYFSEDPTSCRDSPGNVGGLSDLPPTQSRPLSAGNRTTNCIILGFRTRIA